MPRYGSISTAKLIPREILKKVRRVEIRTRGLVNEVFSGEYHSVFKGRGMNFAEVREYQYGDDIRSIDWNVTARTGHPFVKVFEEERELTVMLVVDVSASGDFGTRERMKGEVAVEICALLAFSAIKNNDKVGLIIFSDRQQRELTVMLVVDVSASGDFGTRERMKGEVADIVAVLVLPYLGEIHPTSLEHGVVFT